MGFGILLIGYALSFAFSLSPYYFFADIIGGMIMAYAFVKLSAFHLKFRPAGITAIVYSAVSFISMIEKLGFASYSPLISKLVTAAVAGCILVLHFFMFSAIIALTKEVGLPKITLKTRRNLIILILYYTGYTLYLPMYKSHFQNSPELASYIMMFFFLFQLFWLLMNIILIGSCCKWIGIEGEDAPKENKTKLDEMKEKWSKTEDRIFTPKERRIIKDEDGGASSYSAPKKKKRKKK